MSKKLLTPVSIIFATASIADEFGWRETIPEDTVLACSGSHQYPDLQFPFLPFYLIFDQDVSLRTPVEIPVGVTLKFQYLYSKDVIHYFHTLDPTGAFFEPKNEMVIMSVHYGEHPQFPHVSTADLKFFTSTEIREGKLNIRSAACAPIPPEFKK